MIRKGVVLALVVCAGCRSAPQIVTLPPPPPRVCPELPEVATSSKAEPLEGVTKLELYRHSVRCRALAQAWRDRAIEVRLDRDDQRRSLGVTRKLLEAEKEETKRLSDRPSWWTTVWISLGTLVGGGVVGVVVGLTR